MNSCAKYILLTALCLLILPVAALCQSTLTPRWFNDMGSAGGSVNPTAIKVDAANNLYVTGSFTGIVDFDPSPTTTTNLTAPAGSTYGFIAKYRNDGTLLWAYAFAGASVFPSALAISSDGSISITGKFSGAMDADPSAGINTLSAFGANDAFVVHLDLNGGFLWAKDIGSPVLAMGNAIATDASGNIYVALQYQSSVTVGTNTYPAKGTTDGMLVKYASDGTAVFAIDLGFTGLENSISGVAIDNAGHIDIIGYLNGPVNFNPLGTAFPSSARNALFVAQYSPDGILGWVKNIEGNFVINTPGNSFKMALDGSSNIYVTSAFSQPVQFAVGTTLNPKGTTDFFVARYGSDGALSVFKGIGGVTGSIVKSTDIIISPDNANFYITGNFVGPIDFSTNNGVSTLPSHGRLDIFVAKYSTIGFNLISYAGAGNAACSNVSANSLAVVGANDIILAGTFCSVTDFGGATCPAFNITAQNANYDGLLIDYTLQTPITNNIITNPANCGGGAGTLIGTVPQGGVGTYVYEWQRSTDGINFTEIVGATGKDYTMPTETGAVYYLRKVFSGSCATSLSNPLTVDPAASLTIQNNFINPLAPPQSFTGCGGAGGDNITGSTPTGGGGGPYTYQWQSSSNNINWTNLPDNTRTTGTGKDLGAEGFNSSWYLRRLVFTPGCSTPSISPVMTFTAVPRLDHITIHATGATTFCGQGNPGTLTADGLPTGGNGTYTYQWKSTTTNDFQNIPGATSADYIPGVVTQTTFYKREVLSGPCYTGDPGNNSNPIIVIVKKLFSVTNNTIAQATPDGTLCRTNADPSPITGQQPGGGTGSFFYQWQQSVDNVNYVNISGATSKDYDPSKITQTTYYRRVVIYTDDDNSNTCATPSLSPELVVKVSVADVSNNTISQLVPDPPLICSIPANPQKITGSGATGSGFTYQWQSSADGITFTDITGAINRDYDPPEISQSTSYRRAAVVADACIAPVYSNIITINVAAAASSNYLTAPANDAFCDQGDAGVIKGSLVTGGGTVSYQWQSSPDDVTYTDIGGSFSNGPDFDPPASNITVYYRRMVTTTLCSVPSATKPVAIRVYHTPKVSLPDSVTVCVGDTKILTVAGGNTYKWSPADGLSATNVQSPTVSPTKTTVYTVEVSDNGHCAVNVMIKVIAIPRPVVDAGPDVRIFKGDHVQLNAKVIGNNVQYSWTPSTFLSNPGILNPVASPTETTIYKLTATTDQGCSIVTDDVIVNVFEKVVIPNSFTPNGDGTNDTWEIVGLSTYNTGVLNVYNRHGTAVFRSVGYSKPWDGLINGKALPFGTYYYTIDLHDGSKPMSGWVALIK